MLVNANVKVQKTFVLPIFVTFLGIFAIGVDNYRLLAILPQLAAHFERSPQVIGLLSSAYALPLALLAPLFGPLSDRLGRRLAMIIGMTIFALALAASGLAPTYEFLLVARFVNGLGAAIFVPAAFAYIADSSDPKTGSK